MYKHWKFVPKYVVVLFYFTFIPVSHITDGRGWDLTFQILGGVVPFDLFGGNAAEYRVFLYRGLFEWKDKKLKVLQML